ncbi:MAG: DUF885 domain-containing protein [bacterium]|nr:DUF885 domain-containing protein [bacterium]
MTNWKETSNQYGHRALAVERRIVPEPGSCFGDTESDAEVFQLPPDRAEQEIAAYDELSTGLRQSLSAERHPQVRLDLELLIGYCERELVHRRLENQLLFPYFNLPQVLFQGLHPLLSPRVDPRRRRAVPIRLRRYAGCERGYPPIAEQYVALLRSRLDQPGLLFPPREAVARDLDTAAAYLAAIGEGLVELGSRRGDAAYVRLRQQLAEADAFVRDQVLPRARADFRLPPELYASHLKRNGVEMAIDELVGRAWVEFHTTRREMQLLARRLDRESAAPAATDYRESIRRLASSPADDDVVSLFRRRVRELRNAVERQGILTLPEVGVRVVTASPAESAMMPFVHVVIPPFLAPDRPEAIDLLVPGKGATAWLAEFSSEAGSWFMAMHEMAHAIQLAVVAGGDMPLVRMTYYTMSEAEGWAVYLENELRPHLPPAAQLLALRGHMLRCARTIFEPQLHRGRVSSDQVVRVLCDDLVLSEAAARQELERYLLLPGQAASYLHGHFRHTELRAEAELALGSHFHRRDYHDFILRQGLIPPALLHRQVGEYLVAARPGLAA